jgi:TonB family protein
MTRSFSAPVSRPPAPPARRSLTLLESGRTLASLHPLQTLAGMLLHGAIVATVAVVSSRQAADAAEEAAERAPLYLAPEQRPVGREVEQRLQYVGMAAGAVPVPAAELSADGDAGQRVTVPGQEETREGVEDTDELGYDDFVLSEIDVDSAVTPDPESGGPTYPELLLTARVEGVVAARFIVDTTGRVTPGSFLTFESTHPLFTEAVVEALPRMKFRPAYVGTQRVSQLVVQSFAFRIAVMDTVVDSAAPRRRPPG